MKHSAAARGARAYVYRFWGKRWLAGLLDGIGRLVVYCLSLGQGLAANPECLVHPKKILVVRLDHIGDVLFSRPALHALRRLYPQAQITVLTSSAGDEVLATDPWVDEIMRWDAPWFARSRPQSAKSFWQMVREIHAQHFDLSLDLRGDLRHHILLFLAKVRVRLGYGITGGKFLLQLAPRLRVGVHEVERDLDLVRVLRPEIPITADCYPAIKLTQAEQLAGEKDWEQKTKRVVIHPAAGDSRKQGSLELFAEIGRLLAQLGCECVLVGTKQERARAEHIAALSRVPMRVLTGHTTLRQLLGLITAADLFVGNDSGPGHMAVTQGKPTVMLWSQTNTPEEWGPWGKSVRAKVVQRPARPEAVAEVVAAVKEFLKLK